MLLRDVRKAEVAGKRVMVRVDFNIQLDARGRLRDVARLRAALPTAAWLLRRGATVIFVSHRGRPAGRQPGFSLRSCVQPLRKLLGRDVLFLSDRIFSPQLDRRLARVPSGQVVLLENIRFERGEEVNDARLGRRLASLCDAFVNEAFSNSHRRHASISGVARYVPAYAGLHLQEEYRTLSRLLGRTARPYVAIIGGGKISTKLQLVKQLLRRADYVLLGGALANTVLQAEGLAIGKSKSEVGMIQAARRLTVAHPKLHIPVDVVVATGLQARRRTRPVGNIRPNERILDIGPDTIELFSRIIRQAKTIVWNGPMGVYETPPFHHGTLAIATAAANAVATSIAGGGETVDAIQRQRLANKFSFLSTGGGAMLEFLEGRKLPGLTAVAV